MRQRSVTALLVDAGHDCVHVQDRELTEFRFIGYASSVDRTLPGSCARRLARTSAITRFER